VGTRVSKEDGNKVGVGEPKRKTKVIYLFESNLQILLYFHNDIVESPGSIPGTGIILVNVIPFGIIFVQRLTAASSSSCRNIINDFANI
jgi:hypothetical protein